MPDQNIQMLVYDAAMLTCLRLLLQLFVLGMEDDFDESIDEDDESVDENDEDEEGADHIDDDDDTVSVGTADLLSEDGDEEVKEEQLSREMASYENMVLHFHGRINSRVRSHACCTLSLCRCCMHLPIKDCSGIRYATFGVFI